MKWIRYDFEPYLDDRLVAGSRIRWGGDTYKIKRVYAHLNRIYVIRIKE
jgi:hypothetical protein